MAAKYFVQPFLANLLQKREGNGPGGLSYLPEVSDVSNIPEGVNYFYYTGETTAEYVNGYIYKLKTTTKTIQVWDIITPAVTEHKEFDLPANTRYIDVLQPGYQFPIGRYYRAEYPEAYQKVISWVSHYQGDDGNLYDASYYKILKVGDSVWSGNNLYKITEVTANGYFLKLENGVTLTQNKGGQGAKYNIYGYTSTEGIVLYQADPLLKGGIGTIRYNPIDEKKYLYCDGLYNITGTAVRGILSAPEHFETDIIITPAVWGWVEKEVEVITWSQHDAQPRAVAKVESTDGTKFIVVENSGTTIEGDVIAKNNVTVKGNLYVEGTEVVTDVETVQSEDDFIKLRFNNPAALGEGQSGLQVLNFDGQDATMFLVVSGDGILRLGLGNELEPVTTRDEAAQMVDGAVTVWNAQAQKIKTGPAAADLVTSEEINTLKALGQEAYDAITTKDINTAYFII